mgnify:CR=1 FL=1
MPKGKGKNNFIKPIVMIGAMAFIVCLMVCVFHIYDIRKSLEKEINEQLVVQLDIAGEILTDDIADTESVVDAVAAELGESGRGALTESQIYRILNKYKSIDDFQAITYIKEDHTIYFDNEWYRDASDMVREPLYEIKENQIYLTNEFWKDSHDYLLLFLVPVMNGEERNGFVVALKECGGILDGDAFSYLRKSGDLILTDEKGVILDCNLTNLQTQDEKYDTIYDYMGKFWKIDKEKISELSEMISDDGLSSGTVQCKNKDGVRYFYSFSSPEVFPGLRILSLYTENVYTGVENTIIIGSVASCGIMMLSVIIFTVIVFKHNSSASQLITQLAFEDNITGGKNLNFFKEFTADMLERYPGIPFMIHRFDISNFRYINEAYGHIRADQLLKIVIEEAREVFYSKELCVRMDADQFALLARNTQDLEERFFTFTDKVNTRALDIGIRYPIKLKRGVYQIKNNEHDISLMIDKANMARKTLIGEEKECVAAYSDLLANDMRKADRIESEMETALFNREFKMYIQPKWDIMEDKLYGGEALVRWMKEDGNMIYPSDFVPVFEKNGFIEQLDLYMLESACKMIREQIDKGGPAYPISVNQSRMLLNDPLYINRITEMLSRYQIPKGYIELEITETVFFTEREKMISILNELKEVEVQLSMDDFGSGYSSLNMLKDFPFDVLKIDKEFFSESITSESSKWILRMIIEMAEGLGIRVICEGVETKEQVEMLRKLGCRYVQGYYYSKPIPAENYVESFCGEIA